MQLRRPRVAHLHRRRLKLHRRGNWNHTAILEASGHRLHVFIQRPVFPAEDSRGKWVAAADADEAAAGLGEGGDVVPDSFEGGEGGRVVENPVGHYEVVGLEGEVGEGLGDVGFVPGDFGAAQGAVTVVSFEKTST